MRGSFSDPPIVFAQSRYWMLALFIVSSFFSYKIGVLLPGFVPMLLGEHSSPNRVDIGLWSIVLMVISAVLTLIWLAIMSLRRFIAASTLSLSPDGMVLKVDGRVRHFEWCGISNVRLITVPRGGRLVVFDYPRPDAPSGWLRRLDKRLGGPDINLGSYWDTSDVELIETIREAQEKWSGRSARGSA
jgi:hypothetical protein